ncbi:Oidioi.mRNA.OKI2018_I69.chr1.g2026.t1.cds [Oikopleura dioica]|uniref:Oidioi.mRNA.OKI2018_I69.chr1.g2026.t1.cds n=1 Tax=Oikopleura dioica TaxID=34765 RepID=A0ABN7ST96_OIKDI|nr:Oidioi.mRNA.OKI2018_I69.chr1.g2026.t1.cds [Oikopleura dioica]
MSVVARRVWPRRALFYTPGSDMRKIEKLRKLSGAGVPDFVALDLEDGVALSAKAQARENIAKTYEGLRSDMPNIQFGIRVNSVSSGLLTEDLRILRELKSAPSCLLLPKVDSPEEVREFVETYSLALGRCRWKLKAPVPLVSFIETAQGLLNMKDSFQAILDSQYIKHEATVFGSDDFVASIGAHRSQNGEELMYARQKLVAHAKAFNIQAIDMVWIDFKNLQGLEENSRQGANLGFTGKQVIHPANIETVQRVFSPSEEKIQWATELLEQFAEHEKSGTGAFVFRGKMIDMPLVKQAENIIVSSSSS